VLNLALLLALLFQGSRKNEIQPHAK